MQLRKFTSGRFGRAFALSLSLSLASGLLFAGAHSAVAADKLGVGSAAPKLNVEHWVQNGSGKFPKVTKFETGKVYVVEFWATTCGPCIQSMPHLAELQRTYADKGLQIVSISNEPLEVVQKFLKKEIASEPGKKVTVADVTQAYCLTTDPDGSSEEDYMLAAHQDGIPCAFIVGKDSKIEWIGHPMEMDGILVEVLEDKWDRNKYLEEIRLIEDIERTVGGFARKKQYAQAVTALDGYLSKVSDPRLLFGLRKSKIDMQIRSNADTKDILKTYEELFATCVDEPLFVQDVAWTAFEDYTNNRIESKKLLRIAIAEMEKALIKVEGGNKANMFDTLARIYFELGETDAAIKAQTQAVQFSDGSDEGTFKEFLDDLKSGRKK